MPGILAIARELLIVSIYVYKLETLEEGRKIKKTDAEKIYYFVLIVQSLLYPEGLV